MQRSKKIISIRQLPIIEQALDEISKSIDLEIKKAKELVPIDPSKTTSSLKKIRAKLKKDFDFIELQRKAVKSEIMKPYLEFESIYKSKISDKYKEADNYFKNKISEIESEVKTEKEIKIKTYFDDLTAAKNISGIDYEDLKIDVKISGSLRSYYEQVKNRVENISNDFEAINALNLDENQKYEFILEYKKTFDLTGTVLKLEQKRKDIEKLKEKQEKPKEILEAPEDDEIFEMTFTVRGTKKKLKALKQYLIENKLI
jgi:hypothetical protein